MAAVNSSEVDVYTECGVQIYVALLKFHMNPMSRLAKNGNNPSWPPANILTKIDFYLVGPNPIFKCDMSFLTFVGAWNPLLDL